jgi:molecular chaperone GrpE
METSKVNEEAELEMTAENQESGQEQTAAGDGAAPDELATLRQQLEEATAKAAENLDGWQRAAADLANYKKRVERERAEAHQATTGALVSRLLPVIDDFDRALKDAPTGEETRKWVEGIALIQRKLHAIIEGVGVERIEAEGAMFDPYWHEAITHDESDDHNEGEVIEVVQQGYRLGDRVLRPALVRVAK